MQSTTTYTGILGATTTILITTLDDCVWLVPFLSSNHATTGTSSTNCDATAANATSTKPTTSITTTQVVRIQHAIIFSCTLIGLTSIIVIITDIFKQQLLSRNNPPSSIINTTNNSENMNSSRNANNSYEILVEGIGAVLCWILAGYYFFKSWQKRRRRRQRILTEKQQQQQQHEEKSNFVTSTSMEHCPPDSNYGSCDDYVNGNNTARRLPPDVLTAETTLTTVHSQQASHGDTSSNKTDTLTFQPCTIITLTISGALDEVSYFPSLLLGHIFTGTELIYGTILTVVIMLLIVTQLLSKCQPLLSCLDQIPLYGIITLYAIFLTINLIVEITSMSG